MSHAPVSSVSPVQQRETAAVAPIPRAINSSFTNPYVVCDDFLPHDLAAAMRQDIEAHFAKPGAHQPDTHQVWNYWHVPQLYTYLRTNCDKVIALDRMRRFMAGLTEWSAQTLGMGYVTWPYLSLYVGGCRQGLHNDSTNGRFAFVYSLTKRDRATIGGDTIVFKESNAFRSRLTAPGAGITFYDRVAPVFNRLAVFDDRLPHAVERVEGSMDPVEGRFVLHGHISESGAIVRGPLSSAAVDGCVREGTKAIVAEIEARPERYHGPVVLRFTVLQSGKVAQPVILVDRVACGDERGKGADGIANELLSALTQLTFPTATGTSEATVPIVIGGPLPWMRQTNP
jgi:hypothetical protein